VMGGWRPSSAFLTTLLLSTYSSPRVDLSRLVLQCLFVRSSLPSPHLITNLSIQSLTESPGLPRDATDVDIKVRQKEVVTKYGSILGQQWCFQKLPGRPDPLHLDFHDGLTYISIQPRPITTSTLRRRVCGQDRGSRASLHTGSYRS